MNAGRRGIIGTQFPNDKSSQKKKINWDLGTTVFLAASSAIFR
jgi:hypothetical protein